MSPNWADDQATSVDAARIAIELGHPECDCIYLALALRIGTELVTAGKRFIAAVAGTTNKPAMVALADLLGNKDFRRFHMQTP